MKASIIGSRNILVDEELSIGDYILTNGAITATVVVDAVARLTPGVLGEADSATDESFSHGLLEYPHYTRPAEFRGWKVPEILLSGNHAAIEAWRKTEALKRTVERRPDLTNAGLSDEASGVSDDGAKPENDESAGNERERREEPR